MLNLYLLLILTWRMTRMTLSSSGFSGRSSIMEKLMTEATRSLSTTITFSLPSLKAYTTFLLRQSICCIHLSLSLSKISNMVENVCECMFRLCGFLFFHQGPLAYNIQLNLSLSLSLSLWDIPLLVVRFDNAWK